MSWFYAVFYLLKRLVWRRGGQEFTFTCPDCPYFYMDSNNVEVLAKAVTLHMQGYHGH